MKKFAIKIDDEYLLTAFTEFLHNHYSVFDNNQVLNSRYLAVVGPNRGAVFVKDLPPNYPSISFRAKSQSSIRLIEG
jgi:hypothetical protein